uniref:Phospholipid phosphatase related 5b n=1 Tax=Cyclopterus lumpus TaxID=8103 RepID=A0A8C3G7X2_CYCLU
MLYFQLVIMAGTVMLAYYFEYTDTFSVHVQGFFCYDTAYTKPYLGPEDSSAVPPVLLYALVAGLPTLLITVTETVLFLVQYTSKEFDRSEKTVATGDCCYLNPLVRRTFRFLGESPANAKTLSVVFLVFLCLSYLDKQILHSHAGQNVATCTLELAVVEWRQPMYVTCTVQAKGTRLAKPVLSLGLMCLAFLTGLNRVAEYRNHWSDVIAGFIIGTAIAAFLVRLTRSDVLCVCVGQRFRGCVTGYGGMCVQMFSHQHARHGFYFY